ncbi:JmjC domain, hydroxylase [Seminavis robusta]|uniref:JmjC domain, hydroxylase n=1 Tax=Seminavis robusta TaxID=568900 RepID=A0A9N8E4K0_9STRA|nr:JmjC domain, hydroxylase [Seminavis robusta]|eukprot:Sro643_g180370.1 JmjC domain, hydroxylase (801) ;mRNA; r:39034-41436
MTGPRLSLILLALLPLSMYHRLSLAAGDTVHSDLLLRPVIDLDVDTFAPTIQSQHTWTCLLFYDRFVQDNNLDKLMSSLQERFATSMDVGFAKLDIRRHSAYRQAYDEQEEELPQIENFYKDFLEHATDLTTLSHVSFLNWPGDLYFPPKLVLMKGDNYNVYATVPNINQWYAHVELQLDIATQWLETALQDVHDNPKTMAQVMSPIQREVQRAKNYHRHDINSFPGLEEYMYQFHKESDSTQNLSSSPHRYQNWTKRSYSDSLAWLEQFAVVVHRYLSWVDGYENLWDEERRKREDEQCQFGIHLDTLNQQLRMLVDNMFDNKQDRGPRKRRVPVILKGYLDDFIFGYGRSPTSLRWYLQHELKDKLGNTPAERRVARKITDPNSFELIKRLRQYMKVYEVISLDEDTYKDALARLVSEWHNLVGQFHGNLQQSYLQYLEKQRGVGTSNHHKTIQVLDMNEPGNHVLLTNYTAFHQTYTQPRIPVLLENVNMTTQQYTLEYLQDVCGAMDVTNNVYHEATSGGRWGALERFELPDELLNDARLDGSDWDSDGADRSLTLQQYLVLSEHLDHLSLHDVSLPMHCARILHDETLNDPAPLQKFRLPTVAAGYDLLQRLPLYGSARSGPSLLIEKKGSKSKLNINRAATGYFMYLISGRKRWMVAHPSERVFLYEDLNNDAVVLPDVLAMDMDPERFHQMYPLLNRVENMYEVIQEPGQLMYIPPNSPHAVVNLEDTIGVALNLVSLDAFADHLHNQIHADRDFAEVDLALRYWLFDDDAELPIERSSDDFLYTSFAHYKGQ